MAEKRIGVVTHYFTTLQVAAVRLTDGPVRVGDRIHVLGHTSDFYQTVSSMQIEHDKVEEANVGDEIGMKMTEHAREHDAILVVTEE
ncbi:unnamed protein product [marine sediment metagenome]|uniref:Translation elongation factor EFTu-like domain-containing protein n=1 Tax=marine sediment metagenome TaxID=412755 RepID=X0UIC2_9ZZZZ